MSRFVHLVPFACIIEEVEGGAGIAFVPGSAEYSEAAAVNGGGSTGEYPHPFFDSGIGQRKEGCLLLRRYGQGNQQEKYSCQGTSSAWEEG